jgi:hypothetical protein
LFGDVLLVQATSLFVIPGNFMAYELGQQQNLTPLREVLSKYAFGKFWVTSGAEEQELCAVRRTFDDGVNNFGWGVLHCLVRDGDAVAQCRLLLSVGIDPDKPIKRLNQRPSHFASCYGRPLCAEALARCRPNLSAVDREGEKPNTKMARVSFWSRTEMW